jgi:4-amino-4-deoxy-L-arabinose transferase-like glycosyltransferase
MTPAARLRWALLGAVGLIAVLRLARITTFPPVVADEGVWLFSVREWLRGPPDTWEDFPGQTYYWVLGAGYAITPAYHWVMGAVFTVFGFSLHVARVASGLAALVGLAFFYGLARRLFDARTALWAFLLLGTSFAATAFSRQALIEPFQITWMIALAFFWVGRGRASLIGIAVCTAGLLLTKFSGAFLIPALILASVHDRRRDGPLLDLRALDLRKVGAVAAGALAAAAVFAAILLSQAEMGAWSWEGTLLKPQEDPSGALLRVGRFAIVPDVMYEFVQSLAQGEPFLFALAVAATVRGLVYRQAGVAVWWFVIGFVMLAVSLGRLAPYSAMLYPAMALAVAWFVMDLERVEPRPDRKVQWTTLLLAVVVGYSVLRGLAGIGTTRDPTAPAVAWLSPRLEADHVVVAAPYVLVQLPGARHLSMWNLREGFREPSCEELERRGVDWVLVEDREWRSYVGRGGTPRDQADELIAGCGRRTFHSPRASVYRLSE